MFRVIVTSGKGFDSQAVVQKALLEMRTTDPHAVLVTGTYAGEVLAAKIWAMMGGDVEAHAPQWKIHGKDAGRIRNDEVLRKSADMCISLEHDGELPYMARVCQDRGIKLLRYSDESNYRVIDALP